MKPVDQTRFVTDGNCMSACLDSIFELPLEGVPDLREEDWNEVLQTWLAERGLVMLWLFNKPGSGVWGLIRRCGYLREAWCVAGGKSPRGYKHLVVWRHGEMQHDPHPSRDGLKCKPEDFGVLVALDPSR